MLPLSHRRAYQGFLKSLERLSNLVDEEKIKGKDFQEGLADVEQVFQQQVLPLTSDAVDPRVVSRWQSVQTEIHRGVKLLQVDGMLVRSSRQPGTSEKRLAALGDRLSQLIRYCHVLLDESQQ